MQGSRLDSTTESIYNSTSGFVTTNNPTATRTTLISPTTRHLIHFGTEITIGTPCYTR